MRCLCVCVQVFASLRVYVCLCIAPMRCCEWMLKSSNGKAFAHDIHHITQRSVVTRRNSADITAAASIRHDKREIKLLVILAERLKNGIKRNTNFYQVREREKNKIDDRNSWAFSIKSRFPECVYLWFTGFWSEKKNHACCKSNVSKLEKWLWVNYSICSHPTIISMIWLR